MKFCYYLDLNITANNWHCLKIYAVDLSKWYKKQRKIYNDTHFVYDIFKPYQNKNEKVFLD